MDTKASKKERIKILRNEKAFELLKELWLSVPLSEETWDSIDCELANDISALFDPKSDEDYEEEENEV